MNETRLRTLLREAPAPDSEEAERRGLGMVETAFAERRRRAHSPLPRLALVLAVAALVGALLLSPAGASVRDWVGDQPLPTPTERSRSRVASYWSWWRCSR